MTGVRRTASRILPLSCNPQTAHPGDPPFFSCPIFVNDLIILQ